MFTTSKHRNVIHFTLTKKEYDNCDFLIAYYVDMNWFFIVPKADLKSVSGGKQWKFILTRNLGSDLIIDFMKEPKMISA